MDRARTTAVAGLVCLLAPLLVAAPSAPAAAVPAAAAFPGENGLIAFVSDRDGDPAIYVMEPNGDSQLPIAISSSTELTEVTSPTWSPDGTRLAFVGTAGTNVDVYVMNADGSGLSRLTDDPAHDTDPAWSPDGSRIAFASDRGRAAGSSQIWVVNDDGGDETLLISAPVGGTALSPSWSPDGDRIAYQAITDDSGIAVANADGSNPTRLITSQAASDPDWAPDGIRIAFSQADGIEGGNQNIYVMDADGTDVTRMTDDPDSDTQPAWSPDGQSIAFTHTPDEGSADVWSVTRIGRVLTRLTTDDAQDWFPTWQPTGTYELSVTPGSATRTVGEQQSFRFALRDVDTGSPGLGRDLLIRITGPHAQTASLDTDGDGQAVFSWVGSQPGTDTVTACADLDRNGACDSGEPAQTSTVVWSSPTAFAAIDEPRLAFTDDADALYSVTVERTQSGVDAALTETFSAGSPTSYATELSGFEAGPKHEGEAGGTPGQTPAFVSTRDDPNGEVYLADDFDSDPDPNPAARVTCDPGDRDTPGQRTGRHRLRVERRR